MLDTFAVSREATTEVMARRKNVRSPGPIATSGARSPSPTNRTGRTWLRARPSGGEVWRDHCLARGCRGNPVHDTSPMDAHAACLFTRRKTPTRARLIRPSERLEMPAHAHHHCLPRSHERSVQSSTLDTFVISREAEPGSRALTGARCTSLRYERKDYSDAASASGSSGWMPCGVHVEIRSTACVPSASKAGMNARSRSDHPASVATRRSSDGNCAVP